MQLWAQLCDTTYQPLKSLRICLTLLVLASIGYGVYKLGSLKKHDLTCVAYDAFQAFPKKYLIGEHSG